MTDSSLAAAGVFECNEVEAYLLGLSTSLLPNVIQSFDFTWALTSLVPPNRLKVSCMALWEIRHLLVRCALDTTSPFGPSALPSTREVSLRCRRLAWAQVATPDS